MTRLAGRHMVCALLAVAACSQALAIAGPDAKDAAEISALVSKYATAVSAADTMLASEVWADSEDVSFIHPLGHEHGWQAIKRNVFEKLMGETFSERSLKVQDLSVHVHGDGAWAEFYWDFVAKLRSNGESIETHGRETQVYSRRAGRWRLVHVHYSGMPASPGTGAF